MLFSLLDKLILLSPHYKLIIFRALTSSLTAIFLSMVIFWFYGEFGLITSIIVLISIALSSWLVVFGGKLWWSLWSFFLPMVAVMYFLRNKNLKNLNITIFGLTIFGVVFIKCFISGYEYISTALIMMMVPFIYYCILEKLELKPFIKLSSVAVVSSIFALLLSFAVLSIQIASVDGSIQSGVQHIIYSLGKRTYGDPNLFPSIYQASLQAKTMDVLFTYIKGNYFASNHGFTSIYGFIVNKLPTIGYSHLIITFGIASVLLWALRTKTNTTDLKSRKRSLVITTWFSLLAPLSWFIIFKAHSYIHEGMNFIVWQMPYTLFGFAECGLVIQTIIEEVHKNRKSTPDKI